MRNKARLPIALLLVCSSVPAEQGALEGATKQLLKDTATQAEPHEAVEGTKAAGQTLEKAKSLKESGESAPSALKGQAQEAIQESAKQKLEEAVPEEAKQGVKAVENSTEAAKELKGQVDSVPKSTGEASKAIKGKAQEEATKKALDLLP